MSATPAADHPGYGTQSYRAYVLGALLLVSTINFVDRMLINIVGEAIKVEFGLSNLMLGLIGGPAFAILYSLLGVPIARLADRTSRITVVAAGAALFSGMTALCGFAANFWQLALARIGVGIGEAAATAPSHSALSDYFPSRRRATALAIFSLGVPIGSTVAAVGGGWLTQNVDWRAAFWILGAPGILVALLVKMTVKEPPRPNVGAASPRMIEVVRALGSKTSFWFMAFGGSLVSFFGFGISQFKVSHLVRNYELGATLPVEIANASYIMALSGGLATGLGIFLGGFIGDRIATTDRRMFTRLCAAGVGIAVPLYAVCFLQESLLPAVILFMVAPVFHYLYLGPMFAIAQGVASPRMRATATATLLLVVNLIGYALGPPFVGALNDMIAAQHMSDAGLAISQCAGIGPDDALAAICAEAQGAGIRYAMTIALVFPLMAVVLFLLAGRTLRRDMESLA